MPAPSDSVVPGVPEMSRMAATTTTSAIAVPRSGSASTSRQKRPTRTPTGRQRSFSVRGAGRFARYAAAQIASAIFASSDGWKVAGPNAIHRRAPLTRVPIPSTTRHRNSAVMTSDGASARRRR